MRSYLGTKVKATPLQPDRWVASLSEKSSLHYPIKPWQRFQSYCWAYVFSLYRNLTNLLLTVLQGSVLAVGETRGLDLGLGGEQEQPPNVERPGRDGLFVQMMSAQSAWVPPQAACQ